MNMHALALAYAFSTLSGLRVSYPVAALALAAHAHLFHVPANFAWLRADGTSAIALIACVAEMIVHKFHRLETMTKYVHKFLSPVVGGAAAFAVDPSQGASGALPVLLGAGNAFAVHSLRTTARATGSAFLLGAVGPLASFLEDGVVAGSAATAFFAAQKTAWVVCIAMVCCWLLTYRAVPRRTHRRRVRA